MPSSPILNVESFERPKFDALLSLLDQGVADEVAPGMVAALWERKSPGLVRLHAVGNRSLVPHPAPMAVDTVFDLASLTKAVGTATLFASLVERGWVRWNTRLADFFPGFPASNSGITMEHLLSHSAGFVAWEPFWEVLRDRFAPTPIYKISIDKRQSLARELVLNTKAQHPPGAQTLYSDISMLLLGFVLEELTSLPLDEAVSRWVWKRMGINGMYFNRIKRAADNDLHPEVAATECSTWRGALLQGQVHDDNTWAMGGYAGHAGAFGRAIDVMQFVRSLFDGFLGERILDQMWTPMRMKSGCEFTRGWSVPSGETPSAGSLFSPHSVGHLGFTGTSLWIDREAEIAVVLLTNRVHFSRENIRIRAFRPLFHEALRRDLGR